MAPRKGARNRNNMADEWSAIRVCYLSSYFPFSIVQTLCFLFIYHFRSRYDNQSKSYARYYIYTKCPTDRNKDATRVRRFARLTIRRAASGSYSLQIRRSVRSLNENKQIYRIKKKKSFRGPENVSSPKSVEHSAHLFYK